MALNKNARLWVKALRSGKYKRGKEKLHPTEDRWCCLGVACEVYAKVNKVKKAPYYLEPGGDFAYLPPSVRKWLGLNSAAGGFYKNGKENSLANVNDSGKSFSYIARLIESEPGGLFVKTI